MTLTLEIEPDVEKALEADAEKAGVPLTAYVVRVLTDYTASDKFSDEMATWKNPELLTTQILTLRLPKAADMLRIKEIIRQLETYLRDLEQGNNAKVCESPRLAAWQSFVSNAPATRAGQPPIGDTSRTAEPDVYGYSEREAAQR